MAGIRPVLFATLAFVLAHNILYTYIAPYLQGAGLADQVDRVLLAFGIAALGGIWIVGVMIDRWLRIMTIASTTLFLLAAIVLGIGTTAATIYVGVLLWGLAFGGAATLFQTASTHAAGKAADVAQSMVVTAWNIAIAGGGLAGGYLLETLGAGILPWSLCILLVPCLFVILMAGRHGFPAARAL
jgi:predicted MFS family arabinose efflux permease